MWFDSWSQLVRVLLTVATAYLVLVGALRVSGKRTLSKLNAFDLIVTVALGSTLATIALSSDVAVAEGLAALFGLIGLQYGVAAVATRVELVRRAVRSEPTIVLDDGRLIDGALHRSRLTPADVRQAVRGAGIGGLELVAAVVLETDGTLSVISRDQRGSGSAVP